MPEWLKDAAAIGHGLTFATAIGRMSVAVAIGLVIAVLYRRCVGRGRPESEAFATAAMLICVLVAMTAMVIDNNVARAFSLVGALAIVRFRTVVEDTRDTAFVIFAVVAGMSAGVGNWVLCLVGVPIVALVALSRAEAPRTAAAPAGPELSLLVRIGAGDDPRAALEPALNNHLATVRLVRTATARQGAAFELTYHVRLRDAGDLLALVKEANAVKGVQHVELGEA